MTNVIACNNLTHYYGEKLVFENLNFQVKEGRILGLLGKNGVGKTTAFNILNGFLQPTSGTCSIFGENSMQLGSETKARIAFLIEGHIQYSFLNIRQIEKFYSGFYTRWNPEPFWELMSKLNVSSSQKISTMSCGQRSQVALGLILAQDADLLILDDFSMGLDPGYRRLFIDYLREYARAKNKTIFTTSHIVQDLERLIDDVIILDKHKVVVQLSVGEFMQSFNRFDFDLIDETIELKKDAFIVNIEQVRNKVELYTFSAEAEVLSYLEREQIRFTGLKQVKMELEDAFIGLTGKY